MNFDQNLQLLEQLAVFSRTEALKLQQILKKLTKKDQEKAEKIILLCQHEAETLKNKSKAKLKDLAKAYMLKLNGFQRSFIPKLRKEIEADLQKKEQQEVENALNRL